MRAVLPFNPMFNEAVCVDSCGSTTCAVGEDSYLAGELFRAEDGCNACICGADGSVRCTTQECPEVTCDGGYRPGDTWFIPGESPQLCRCTASGEVDCEDRVL